MIEARVAAREDTGRSGAIAIRAQHVATGRRGPGTLPPGRPRRSRATPSPAGETATTGREPQLGISFRFQSTFEAVGHRSQCAICVAQSSQPSRTQRIKLPPSSATLSGRFPNPRSEQALVLQPVQRRVNRVDRDIPAGTLVDFLSDGGAVGVFGQPKHPQQDELFEIAKRRFWLEPHCGGYPARLDGSGACGVYRANELNGWMTRRE
jgi:hypothetical protein